MLKLGVRSLWNRRFVALLTVLSIALSVALILGVERVRTEARESFANSASGIDLIVAPRGNSVQILLATIFGVGSTEAGLSWQTFEWIEQLPEIGWAVPVAMGDNHRGFPVIGTNTDYFKRFRHSGSESLVFEAGTVFADSDKAVVGSEVADRFGYELGTEIVLAHGAGAVAFDVHGEAPVQISGILAPTGTAVDRMVLVSLEGFDRLHQDRRDHQFDPFNAVENENSSSSPIETKSHGEGYDHAAAPLHNEASLSDRNKDEQAHEPETINAVYVGLVNRPAVIKVQSRLSEFRLEPLSAVMPNVALLELWSITGMAEIALRLMASAVVLAGLIGLLVMLSATLEGRRREFSILRSVGAPPLYVFGLIVLESGILTLSGIVLGYVVLTGGVLIADPILAADFGLRLDRLLPSLSEIWLTIAVLVVGTLASLIPAWRVYRMTLSDGITVRV